MASAVEEVTPTDQEERDREDNLIFSIYDALKHAKLCKIPVCYMENIIERVWDKILDSQLNREEETDQCHDWIYNQRESMQMGRVYSLLNRAEKKGQKVNEAKEIVDIVWLKIMSNSVKNLNKLEKLYRRGEQQEEESWEPEEKN